MQANTFSLRTVDGIDLMVYRWLPPVPCKGIVQVAHGLAEHAARYGRLAEALNAAGYGVYASDHRGHGQTCKNKAELGFFAERNGWHLCVEDLWLVNRYIAGEQPGMPIVLLGHSMGATLAEQLIVDHGDALAGVVLSGPSGVPNAMSRVGRFILKIEKLRLGPMGRSKLANDLSFGAFNKGFAPARTAFDWLSRDPAEVDKYVADPLCGFPATVQLWLDLIDGWIKATSASSLARIPKVLPVYVIAGSHDPVSGNTRQLAPLLAAYQATGLKNLQHRFYSDARHELFNETNRDEVTRDLIVWLDSLRSHESRCTSV